LLHVLFPVRLIIISFSRGKRIFRKFSDETGAESDGDDLGLLAARPDLIDCSLNTHVRPLTRSSVKPRVLFSTARSCHTKEIQTGTTDEEATTDVEEHTRTKKVDSETSQPPGIDTDQQPLVTPAVQSTVVTPSSPGATQRSLRPRSGENNKAHDATPSGVTARTSKRISPFDGWMRKKSSGSKKRDSDDTVVSSSGPATKKSKVNRA
jgi:hypothetical protein